MMRAPVGRGLVAIGNAAGQLVLTDPRAGVHHLTPTNTHIHYRHASSDAQQHERSLCEHKKRWQTQEKMLVP